MGVSFQFQRLPPFNNPLSYSIMSCFIHLLHLIETSGPLQIPDGREPWQKDYDLLVSRKKLVISKFNGVDSYCLPPDKIKPVVATKKTVAPRVKLATPAVKVKSVIRGVAVVQKKSAPLRSDSRKSVTKTPVRNGKHGSGQKGQKRQVASKR